CRGARRKAARLGVADIAVHAATDGQTDLRQLRGLARTRFARDDDDLMRLDGASDFLAPRADGQLLRETRARQIRAPRLDHFRSQAARTIVGAGTAFERCGSGHRASCGLSGHNAASARGVSHESGSKVAQMNILLCGANGFIGRHLAAALEGRGHRVVRGVRDTEDGKDAVAIDYTRDHGPDIWRPRLEGIDVVINAVGILRERGTATFGALHARAPIALFDAAAQVGVRRVVQIAALGADEGAQSRYHRSKKQADDYLATLPLDWVVVQPSLVYGPGGTSAKLFDTLAALPLIPLPGGGRQRIQP